MKIEYGEESNRYFDMNGEEIHEGDIVLMNGRKQEVYLTENGYLGTDATNPVWIEKGRAFPTQFGIYPFNERDEPILVK
jgi:hypothetical protein